MEERKQGRGRATNLLFFTGLVMLFAPAVRTSWSQVVKGAIEGGVVDQTGAVVPAASIVVLDPATSSAGKSLSDNTGTFRILLLSVGTYNLTVSKQGFSKLSVVEIQVDSARTTEVGTLRLEIGPATTTVSVTAHPPLVEAMQAQVTNTLTGATITELPAVGQNEGLDNLALLFPGVEKTQMITSRMRTALGSVRMERVDATTISKSTASTTTTTRSLALASSYAIPIGCKSTS